jgi:hypothetical protein
MPHLAVTCAFALLFGCLIGHDASWLRPTYASCDPPRLKCKSTPLKKKKKKKGQEERGRPYGDKERGAPRRGQEKKRRGAMERDWASYSERGEQIECGSVMEGAMGTGTCQRTSKALGNRQYVICYTCVTSAFGTITVPCRRGIGPMQLRRKRAHPCCSRRQQTGTGWPSKPGTHQASSARESKPGPAHPHRAEVKMQDAASTRDGKQPCTQSKMTRMQRKEKL